VRSGHAFFLASLFVLFALPLAIIVVYAFAANWRFPDLLPTEFSPRPLQFVTAQSGSIAMSLLSSTTYSLATVAATFGLCVLPASVLAREEFRLKHLLEAALLAPALVPSITFAMGIHYLFIRAGLADNAAGVVLVLTAFSYPYMLRALTAGFMAYGPEYEVCAANLGASLLMRIMRVDLPLLLPSAVSGGTVVFLVAFSEYFLVFLIGGGAVPSYTGYLFPFLRSSDRSVASMLTLLFLVVPILLFLLLDITVNRLHRRRSMI
jgi:putative spermidine/putrescine transport system permease protein